MTFRDAVTGTNGLTHAYRDGLQALKATDRPRIRCADPRKLTGSVDLDHALSDSHPNDPRWDYGIGVRNRRRSEVVIWVEVHPASSRHIQNVLDKLSWLRRWLASSAPLLDQLPRRFVWVASGKVALPRDSQQRRRLAAEGISLIGQRLSL